ncbi:MAG: hypothetical protein MR270_03125 [Erysipelotrichaceae bacterium]|nr:hypothetical protein [Erysipelotrichaceae bacterium]
MVKKYYKKFGVILVQIIIDFTCSEENDYFNFIFKKWIDCDVQSLKKYIIRISNYDNKADIIVNTFCSNWKFELLNSIENYICVAIADLSIHGSALVFDNKMYWLVGKRKSGKSTLAYNIIERFFTRFIDDDCIILINNKTYGLGLPSKSRTMIKNKDYIAVDEYGYKRYLYFNENIIDEIDLYPLIIFICYSKDNNSVLKCNKKEVFEQLLCNCKYSSNKKKKFSYLINIATNSIAYSINYSCFDNFLKIYNKYIKEGNL